MKYTKLEEIRETHSITQRIMATKAYRLTTLDEDNFIERFEVIPEDVDDPELFKTTFIEQVAESQPSDLLDENDSTDEQFDVALRIFYQHLQTDFFNLSHALKHINLPEISLKGLYHGFLESLDDELNQEQIDIIYSKVDEDTKNTFFQSNEGEISFQTNKTTKELIRHLRKNTDIKIKLTPDQVQNILDDMEMGDLINLATLTSTTKSKATDFWTHMLVTTYRWSGAIVEITALARYLPFLITLNNYLVAPIVSVIGFIVALFNYNKHQIKEANLNLKFIKRSLSKNHFKNSRDELKSEVDALDNFDAKPAYSILLEWIKNADLSDNFESTLEEMDKVHSSVKKTEILKTALLKNCPLFFEDSEVQEENDNRHQLRKFINKIAPEAYNADKEDNNIEIPPKKPLTFMGRPLPVGLANFIKDISDFFTPIFQSIKKFMAPLIAILKKYAAPFVLPAVFGFITAAGIVTLTLFYTLAPEILIPITVIAIIIGAATAVLRFLRDRQRDLNHSIMHGSKIDKCALKDEINDLNQHKKICAALKEVQQENEHEPEQETVQETIQESVQESVQESAQEQVEITVKGENNVAETFFVSKAALLGLKRHSVINDFHKVYEQHPIALSPLEDVDASQISP